MAKKAGHFERYNAFIDGGWAARLNRREANLWHAYNRFADASGQAWPSIAELADKIGERCLSRSGRKFKKCCMIGDRSASSASLR